MKQDFENKQVNSRYIFMSVLLYKNVYFYFLTSSLIKVNSIRINKSVNFYYLRRLLVKLLARFNILLSNPQAYLIGKILSQILHT